MSRPDAFGVYALAGIPWSDGLWGFDISPSINISAFDFRTKSHQVSSDRMARTTTTTPMM
jgi:hypothetical protein